MAMAESEATKYLIGLFKNMYEFVEKDPYRHEAIAFCLGWVYFIAGFMNFMYNTLQLFLLNSALDIVIMVSGGMIFSFEFDHTLIPSFIRTFLEHHFTLLYKPHGRSYWITFVSSLMIGQGFNAKREHTESFCSDIYILFGLVSFPISLWLAILTYRSYIRFVLVTYIEY